MDSSVLFDRIQRDVKSLEEKASSLQLSYQGMHESVAKKIKDLLVEAKVFDAIHELETQRDGFRKSIEEQLSSLKSAVLDLNRTEAYLKSILEEKAAETPIMVVPEVDAGEKSTRIRAIGSKLK